MMKKLRKIISLLLVMVTVVLTLSSCGKKEDELSEEECQKISEMVTNIITPIVTEQPTNEPQPTPTDIAKKAVPLIYQAELSYNWEDYVGNIDAFVYGLIVTQLEQIYDVFGACITLEDGTVVHGIAYSDYDYVFEAEEDKMIFFPAGFIPFIGEPVLPSSIVDEGIEIENLEYSDDKYGFVLAYETPEFKDHCVVWGKYLNYGVNDEGRIFYTCNDYNIEKCDSTLGTLYSYDEEKVVIDKDFGEFVPPTGESLYYWIDYQALQDEVNRILEQQDEYFKNIDVQTIAYYSKSSVEASLLALQEETFMGHRVKDLLEIASDLDPSEYINFTPDVYMLLNLSHIRLKSQRNLPSG